ncbi:MAG: orotate phosphoribosyltransferase [Deltaproteobacteria bacterium]|nr:orotate phosphoribosyltransferase [Deltaproteobacteria bacterium]
MKEDLVKLRKIIFEKSYQEGEFVLSSGKTSHYYFDLKHTTLNAQGIYLISKLFYDMMPENIKAVGGITMGADPLASGLSLYSFFQGRPLMAFYVRKEPKKYGTSKWIEGMGNLSERDPVIILEDVVTSGSSSLKAVRAAEEAGLTVKGVFAVVDREEGGEEFLKNQGIVYKYLLTRTQMTHGV